MKNVNINKNECIDVSLLWLQTTDIMKCGFQAFILNLTIGFNCKQNEVECMCEVIEMNLLQSPNTRNSPVTRY